MENKFDILKNQFHEIAVSLEFAELRQCDSNWKGKANGFPRSSIGLILGGTGTIIVDGVEMHPVKDQLYLIPAYSHQIFFNDGSTPYLKYYCHFNIKQHDIELFDIINVPLCVDAKNPAVAADLFEKMIAAQQEKSITSLIKARQYMMDLVGYYLQCCRESDITLIENASDSAINKAIAYAAETLIGASKLVLESGEHPEKLKDNVCSPGGTTIAGVHALEKNAFRNGVIEAVEAAYKRTLELK